MKPRPEATDVEAWIRIGAEWLLFATWASVSLLTADATSRGALVAAVSLVVAVAVRRKALGWAVALAALAIPVQLADRSSLAVFADLGYAPMLYQLGSSPNPRIRRFGLTMACISLALGPTAFVGVHTASRGHILVLQVVTTACLTSFVTLGGWITGRDRWLSRQRTQDLLTAQRAEAEQQRLLHLLDQAERRERMAHDMHDTVGHSWAVVIAQSDGARYAVESRPEAAIAALETIGETARSAIDDLRAFLSRLRDLDEADGDDAADLDAVLSRMRRAGLVLEVDELGRRPGSAEARLTTTAQVLAEALANALKHGELADPVRVSLDWRDGVTVSVRNTIASTSRLAGTSTGLTAMTARVERRGGHLRFGPEAPATWVVTMRLPGPG